MNVEDPDGLYQLTRDLRVAIEAMIALYPPVFAPVKVRAWKGLIYVGQQAYFRREARALLKRLRAATYMQSTTTAQGLFTILSTYPQQPDA